MHRSCSVASPNVTRTGSQSVVWPAWFVPQTHEAGAVWFSFVAVTTTGLSVRW